MHALSTITSGVLLPARSLDLLAGVPRWARLVASVLLLLAWALVLPRGGITSVVGVVVSAAIALVVANAVTSPRDRPLVVTSILLALLARDVLVGAIDLALMAQGLRWYAPDESVYIGTSAMLWRHWLDPSAPFDPNDPYLPNQYIQTMARLYLLMGENVVLVKLMNTLGAVTAGALAYRTMRNLGMPGARWALLLLVTFPSIALWSALTLKDAYVLFFLMASVWTTSEYYRSRNPLWLAATLAALLPIESVRQYIFITAALAWLALPIALPRWRDRLLTAAIVTTTVLALFVYFQPFRTMGPNLPYIPIFVRSTVAQGAGSSFVEPAPVIAGKPGDMYVIAVPGVTPDPEDTPRVVVVPPGTQIEIEKTTPAPGSQPPEVVTVRPGDVVVIASPGAVPTTSTAPARTPEPTSLATGPSTVTPTPTASPRTVVLNPEAKNTVGLTTQTDPNATSIEGSLMTNVEHLPVGILYTLFAPFPWTARTSEQLATIPEMLLWYGCIAAALVGTWALLSRRDLRFAHGGALAIGVLLILSLIGANTGTLLRSRAMLIPFVLMVSAVGIEVVLAHLRRSRGTTTQGLSADPSVTA